MKKFLLAIAITFGLISSAYADYRMIVPQRVGGGTDIWARIIAKELEKKLGEKIVIENIPGINDIPGFNKFHNELRFDNKTIMVAHGGNGESYLIHNVDYNYHDYTPIGLQNLTIIVGKRSDADVDKKVRFASGSGLNPDAMAVTLLICGPDKTMEEYLQCYNDRMIYVNGMKGNERRLAYLRGELNVTRETPAAYLKHPTKVKENITWFSHGILDLNTGNVGEDPNYKGKLFQEVFKQRWGVYPSGEFYDAYLLVKSYRDVLQKSLWVNKGNPNADKLVEALTEMTQDADSMAAIEKQTGSYSWVVGKDVEKALDALENVTTKKALKNLVWWMRNAFDQQAFYKDDIAKKAK